MSAIVINKNTGEIIHNPNTPDFPEADWLHDPAGYKTLVATSVPERYWKVVGNDVQEMDQAEKDAVDAANVPLEELLDNTEGTATNKVLKVGVVFNADEINNNFATLAARIKRLEG